MRWIKWTQLYVDLYIYFILSNINSITLVDFRYCRFVFYTFQHYISLVGIWRCCRVRDLRPWPCLGLQSCQLRREGQCVAPHLPQIVEGCQNNGGWDLLRGVMFNTYRQYFIHGFESRLRLTFTACDTNIKFFTSMIKTVPLNVYE